MKLTTGLMLLTLSGGALGWQVSGDAQVTYPEEYRNWVHVKSALVSPAHRVSRRTVVFITFMRTRRR